MSRSILEATYAVFSGDAIIGARYEHSDGGTKCLRPFLLQSLDDKQTIISNDYPAKFGRRRDPGWHASHLDGGPKSK